MNNTTVPAPGVPGFNVPLYILLGVCVTLSCVVFSALVVRFCDRR